jgi:hypothetical protein
VELHLLPIGPLVRCDCLRHNPGETSGNILILLGGLNARENLLDTYAYFLATCHLLDFPNSTLLIAIFKGTRLSQNVCELLLRVDIWYRNLGVEAIKEIELDKYRAFSGGREYQQAAVLDLLASSQTSSDLPLQMLFACEMRCTS